MQKAPETSKAGNSNVKLPPRARTCGIGKSAAQIFLRGNVTRRGGELHAREERISRLLQVSFEFTISDNSIGIFFFAPRLSRSWYCIADTEIDRQVRTRSAIYLRNSLFSRHLYTAAGGVASTWYAPFFLRHRAVCVCTWIKYVVRFMEPSAGFYACMRCDDCSRCNLLLFFSLY